LSYKEIQKRAGSDDFHKARAADSALFLLALFPFWHHENISEEIFSYAAIQQNQTMSNHNLPLASYVLDNKLLPFNKDGTWDNFIFKEGVRVLLSFYLIKKDTSGSVHSMHPLVNAWGRERMSVDEKPKCSLIAFATLSASLKNHESQSYGFRRTLVTHVRKNIQYSNNYFDDAYEKFGWLLSEQGYSSEAEKLEIQVLNARNKTLGEEHPDTISAKENLASTYSGLGKYTEAEKLKIQVLHARNKILGEEHPDTIIAMENLASTYSDLGKYTEAEELEIQVLDARKKILGEEHPDTISAMGNLASTYSDLGKYTEAEKLQIQVLDASSKSLGREHPNTILAMGNLASIYGYLGKYTEAEKLKIQVLDATKKFLGKEHPDTILAMGNLATTYSDLGKYTEAEKLQIQVLDARKKFLGEEHPHTILAMESLASTYHKLGKYTEAEKLQIQVLDASSKSLGGEHPHTILAMGNFASIYGYLRKYTEGEKLNIQVLDARKKILGKEHPDTILAMGNLATTYSDLGKYTEAEKLQIQALDDSSKILGGEHPYTIMAMRNLTEIQKAISHSMKVSNAENQLFCTNHGVSVTQGIEGENVDTGAPHASNRALGENDSDEVGAPANLPPTTNVDDRIIHSEKKGIYWPAICFHPILMLTCPGHLFSKNWKKFFKFKSKLLLGFHKRGNATHT